ncbi:hypothetical protein Tco_1376609 [Tanacetum coccineum]
MTKVIKGEFEKLEDAKVEDVSLTCDTSLEVFNNEFNRISGMDDDLFTYEIEVANFPCDSNMDDDSEEQMSHEADDDIGYDPSDIYWIRGDDEIELTDEESSDDEDEFAEVFRIDTNIFDFETPMCKAFKEFNYLLQIDPELLTKDIEGFKTYKDYKNDWIYEWNKDVAWVDEKPWTKTRDVLNGQLVVGEWMVIVMEEIFSVLTLLETRSITKTLNEDDDESRYERRRWNVYTNFDDAYETNHDVAEREELGEICELAVCDIRIFAMIKYSFGQDKEYVAIKEKEYDDLTNTCNDACQAYQEIFRMMDEGWMVTRAE